MALCMSVLASATSRDAPNNYFGFVIGLTVTASAITCGGFDQGSFNPAVTFGMNMANYANDSTDNPSAGAIFLFMFAPLFGSMIAAAVFMTTRIKEYAEIASLLGGDINLARAVGKSGGKIDTE